MQPPGDYSINTYATEVLSFYFKNELRVVGRDSHVGSHIPVENRKGLVHTYHWRTEKGWLMTLLYTCSTHADLVHEPETHTVTYTN